MPKISNISDSNKFGLAAAMLSIAVEMAYRYKNTPSDEARSECVKYMRRAAAELGCTLVDLCAKEEFPSGIIKPMQSDDYDPNEEI